MKQKVFNKLLESGVVAVVRKLPKEKAMPAIKALVRGGVTGIEITVESDGAYELIKEAKQEFCERAAIGAGTVLDGHAAYQAIAADADFIFTPTLKRETIETARRYGKLVIPGTFTPTEIQTAYEWGADVVKVFPANVVGPGYIKNVAGPLSHVSILPTGGIDETNIASFVKAGAVACGVGGSLLKQSFIENGQWGELTALAETYVKEVEKGRMK